jgi:hypothetical protein
MKDKWMNDNIDVLLRELKKHRKESYITCEETCFCWAAAEFIAKEEAAQQDVQRTAEQRCKKHSVVYCAECYPANGVKATRR